VYDNPAALQAQFEKDLNLNTAQFMLMYALYSWPNVALCFFGGFLMDRTIGIRLGAIIFSGLIMLGQVVFAIGTGSGNYTTALIGRFIFALGGENLGVAQNTYAVNWFKGKELNMVFGLQLSFSRLGSTLNMLTSVPIYNMFRGSHQDNYKYLGDALWVGAMLCAFSFGCAILAGYLDKRSARLLGRLEKKSEEVIKISDIKTFPMSFWLVCLVCVAFYVTIFPFIALAIVYYQDKYNVSASSAATINSIVYLISAGASPLFGFVVDRYGRNLTFVAIAIVGTYGCHAMIAFSLITPYVPIVLLGFCYSLCACSLWPMVSLLIPDHQLGTAYGFMQAVQNLGLAVIATVAGIIVDDKGYLWLEVFFLAWLAIALMAIMFLFGLDYGRKGTLNLSAAERKALKDSEKPSIEEGKPLEEEEVKETTSLIRPRTPFELRNRYISRIGVALPDNYAVIRARFVGPGLLK